MGRTTHYVGDSCPDGHRNEPTTRDKDALDAAIEAGILVLVPKPPTCEACDQAFGSLKQSDGRLRVKNAWDLRIPEQRLVETHHALHRALTEERDGLRAALQGIWDLHVESGDHCEDTCRSEWEAVRAALDGEGKA